jgi:transcriptional regulator with XRE-family HTH domain
MPLAALSAAVGVSQPQLCRYEAGVTRVAASRLVAIAGVLGVSVEVLTRDANSPAQPDPAERVEQALLLRAFGGITRADHRSALLALAHALATTAHDTEVDL